MQVKWFMLTAVAAVLAVMPAIAIAEGEQTEPKSIDAAAPKSLAGLWQAIQSHQVQLHKAINTGNLGEVKSIAFAIRDQAHALTTYSSDLTADSTQKLQAGLSKIDDSAKRLEQYGSAGEKTGSEIEAHEMDILLASLAALYSAPDVKAIVEYTCPMHPEVTSDKPGKCPICKMPLVIREDANE